MPAFETPSRFIRWPLYLASLVVGMLIAYHPTLLSGFARMQTDPGDPVLNHYFLEHEWRWLTDSEYQPTFWSPAFFYPSPLVLTFSENLAGLLPLYGMFRLFLPEAPALQALMLLVSVLTYFSMLIVLRWLGVRPVLAVLGGFLFAFCLPRQDQIVHLHMQPHFYAPFAVWHVRQMLVNPKMRNWVCLLALTAAQVLSSIHLGWFLVFSLAVFVVVYCFVDRGTWPRLKTFFRAQTVMAALAAAVWLIGLALFFYPYYVGNVGVRRTYPECAWYLPGIRAWFAAAPGSWWEVTIWGDDAELSERHLFAGIGFYAILLAAAWHLWRHRTCNIQHPTSNVQHPTSDTQVQFAKACLITVAVLFLICMNWYEGVSLWWFVYQLAPGANSMRAVGRIYFAMLLFGLVGGLIGLQMWVATSRFAARAGWIYVALLLVCALEQVRLKLDWFDRDRFYNRAGALAPELRGADVAFVYDDGKDAHYVNHHYAMFAGLWAGVPVINGYSGRGPHDYPGNDPNVSLEALVRFLGNDWQGRLMLLEWGEPMRKRVYRVVPGADPRTRARPE